MVNRVKSCYMPRHFRHLSAFSLFEMAVVLVIVAVLAGGLLEASSLIRAAELRAVISEWKTYTDAATHFREKYHAWPGDMPNATDFWGQVGVVPPGPGMPIPPPPTLFCPSDDDPVNSGTCNGNGDGIVSLSWDNRLRVQAEERATFWQHLSISGLIDGNYRGILLPTINAVIPDLDVPASHYPGAIHTIRDQLEAQLQSFIPLPHAFDAPFMITTRSGTCPSSTRCDPIFSPDDAHSVDLKLDDGKPLIGYVTALPYARTCNAAPPYACRHSTRCFDIPLNNWILAPFFGIDYAGTAGSPGGDAKNQCNLVYRPFSPAKDN